MQRVLIVDDEILVRIGLKATIDWEKNGFIIVGEARNGKEALDLFNKYNPDILLTDIKMPGMDGLELIQQIKSKKPLLKAVILSHYDDFNYAKEAIRLGASEYILKSDLTSENLLDVLKRVTSSANASKTSKNDVNKSENEKANIVEMIFDRKDENTSLQNACDYAKMHSFDINCYVTICFTASYINSEDQEQNQSLPKSIMDVVNSVINEKSISFSMYAQNDDNYLLFCLDVGKYATYATKKITEIAGKLKNNIKQFMNLQCLMGISHVSTDFNDIPALLKESKAVQTFTFFEKNEIMVSDVQKAANEIDIPEIDMAILVKYMETFDYNSLQNYIDEIFDLLFQKKDLDAVRKVFIDFLSISKILFKESKFVQKPEFGENKFNYNVFNKLNNIETVKKYILDIFKELICQKKENRHMYSYVVSKCIEYIKNNYEKNITLTDAAEFVDISKSYLSLLFKQETGINFIPFVTNYRIEKARDLLTHSNLKIYEISEKIGFGNPYYFSKIFKEVTGMSCKDFKNSGNYIESGFHVV